MYRWETGFYVSGKIKLHYHRTGGDKPSMVLVHGLADDGLCWTRVAEYFEQQYDIIMPDLRGHGKSDTPESDYSLKAMADDIAVLISELKLKKPVIGGHSMGAATVMAFAGLYPDTPSTIILEDPPPWWTPPPKTAEAEEGRAWLEKWLTDLKRKTRAELIAEAHEVSPDWTMADIELWADAKQRYSPSIIHCLDWGKIIPVDFQKILGRITCPVLFISADTERGAISGQENIDKLKTIILQMDNVYVKDAGHSIRRHQFAVYTEKIKSFLAEEMKNRD
ncbi:MAG: alpha/beta hydrolase [Spirochaetales bacterium]|nr:alpha/beta hydrolase [Spirochaetales bacterium]